MRSLILPIACTALVAGCDSGEPPKPATTTQPVKPLVQAPEPTPPPAAPPAAATAPQLSPDERLAARVRSVLRDSRDVPGQGVDATVAGGVVTLFGTVPSPEDRARVRDLVAGIDGVHSVVNRLVVVQGS